MEECVSVEIESIRELAETYKNSYFTAAISFAEAQGKTCIDVPIDALQYLQLADSARLVENMDRYGINSYTLKKNALALLIKLDCKHSEDKYINLMIEFDMYKEFQEHIFSGIWWSGYKLERELHYINTEFLTAYPYETADGDTMLICLIKMKEKDRAIEVAYGHSWNVRADHVNEDGDTALTLACREGMSDVALAILKTGNANPGHVDSEDDTALSSAIRNDMEEVALAILQTGDANPGHVDGSDDTALILACEGMPRVAMAILKTGNANPGHISKYNDTALIMACREKMRKVALAILNTGDANPEYIGKDGKTALKLAREHDMPDVVTAIGGIAP